MNDRRDYSQKYYQKNKEKIAARKRLYYQANKERIDDAQRPYIQANKEIIRAGKVYITRRIRRTIGPIIRHII